MVLLFTVILLKLWIRSKESNYFQNNSNVNSDTIIFCDYRLFLPAKLSLKSWAKVYQRDSPSLSKFEISHLQLKSN